MHQNILEVDSRLPMGGHATGKGQQTTVTPNSRQLRLSLVND